MSRHLQLGAFRSSDYKYISASIASKGELYKCPECNTEVILKKGNIRQHHFAHKSGTACKYFESPTESQIHKDAKLWLCMLLSSKRELICSRPCNQCSYNKNFKILPCADAVCKTEYPLTYKSKRIVVDVAYIQGDMLQYIFELYHTHKTCEETRPEPWFELDVSKLSSVDINNKQIVLRCERNYICDVCKISHNPEVNIYSCGETVIPFGKYKGYCLKNVDFNYLKFLCDYDIFFDDDEGCLVYYDRVDTDISTLYENREAFKHECEIVQMTTLDIYKEEWWQSLYKADRMQAILKILQYKDQFNKLQKALGFKEMFMARYYMWYHHQNIIHEARLYADTSGLCRWCFKKKTTTMPLHKKCYFDVKDR